MPTRAATSATGRSVSSSRRRAVCRLSLIHISAYAVREPDEGTPLLTYLEQRAQPLTQSEALLLLRPVVYGVEAMHRIDVYKRQK